MLSSHSEEMSDVNMDVQHRERCNHQSESPEVIDESGSFQDANHKENHNEDLEGYSEQLLVEDDVAVEEEGTSDEGSLQIVTATNKLNTETHEDLLKHLVSLDVAVTPKLLVAIGKGAEVLPVAWLESCVRNRQLMDTKAFDELEQEGRKQHWSLCASIERSCELHRLQGGLFAKMSFRVTPEAFRSIEELRDVIRAAGGQCSKFDPAEQLGQDSQETLTVIISCEEDLYFLNDGAVA
ncbi:hypothetical protein NliqN6_4710 [Naganishia liquefaciens]|uniref:BRCT domain-containing protein n=1 Tax=Naganishia liquefaciens TaxID=104408 RepID=A0A8H3TWU6_9TREE|nr:hypothetical protein NliqN6_4710 [Naganishia liquefaciens]